MSDTPETPEDAMRDKWHTIINRDVVPTLGNTFELVEDWDDEDSDPVDIIGDEFKSQCRESINAAGDDASSDLATEFIDEAWDMERETVARQVRETQENSADAHARSIRFSMNQVSDYWKAVMR